jgi:hypothetical protein
MILKLWLTKGQFTLVDEEDFLFLNQWDWFYFEISKTVGYAARSEKRKTKFLHIELMKKWNKYIEGLEVDHKDRNELNNTKDNLRMATRQQNLRNKGLQSTNTSGYTGVRYSRQENKYRAYIYINGICKHLCVTSSKEEAIKVRREAEIKYFGEFAPNREDQ